MRLAPFDHQLIKGDILPYCESLTASIKKNHAMVKQIIHSGLQRDENPKHYTHLQPRDIFYWKTHLQKDPCSLAARGPQVLLTNPMLLNPRE